MPQLSWSSQGSLVPRLPTTLQLPAHQADPAGQPLPTWAASWSPRRPQAGLVACVFLALCKHMWFLCPGSGTVFLSQARNTRRGAL